MKTWDICQSSPTLSACCVQLIYMWVLSFSISCHLCKEENKSQFHYHCTLWEVYISLNHWYQTCTNLSISFLFCTPHVILHKIKTKKYDLPVHKKSQVFHGILKQCKCSFSCLYVNCRFVLSWNKTWSGGLTWLRPSGLVHWVTSAALWPESTKPSWPCLVPKTRFLHIMTCKLMIDSHKRQKHLTWKMMDCPLNTALRE